MGKKQTLSLLIFLGLALGVLVGQLCYDPEWSPSKPQSAHHFAVLLDIFEFIGFSVFIRVLKMLILPLIATSVLVAVTSVGDFRKLGRLGGWTLVYYFSTMLSAVVLGLVLVSLFHPGTAMQGLDLGVEVQEHGMLPDAVGKGVEVSLLGIFSNLLTLMIPENIVGAMAQGKTLSVIVFFIFFGVVLTLIGDAGRIVVTLAEAVFEIMMRMVDIVLWLAPLGVFSLLAWSIARIGLGVFGDAIGLYMLTVVVGLLIHGLIVLPMVLWVVGKTNPFRYLSQMREALIMAFGTSSSSATLPVTMECATIRGGVSKRSAGLVLPLGSTINMDGTALYEAVAVVFMAQAYGIELGIVQLVIIAFTATLAAVGAAGIPSAGLVTMIVVLDAVNHSLIGASGNPLIPVSAIGLVIGVDRILDMIRTAVNVWGDAVGAKLISRIDG